MLLKYLGFCGSKNASSSEKRYPSIIEELCHRFSLQDLRKSTNNFDSRLIIREEPYVTMYKGCLKHDGANDYAIALKRRRRDGYVTLYKGCLKHDGATDYAIALKRRRRNSSPSLKKEIELLCQLRHPNLVSLIGFCIHKKEEIIVHEYMPNGSLHDQLHNRDIEPLSWKKRLEICIGAARGLHYLHTGAKRTIVHLDIKPGNILLDNNMVPKLSDFGLSLLGPLSMSKPKPIEVDCVAGTLFYIAPEYFQFDEKAMSINVTDKCDVYSFGVVLLQVACTTDNDTIVNMAKMLTYQQLSEVGSKYNTMSSLHIILYFMREFPIEEIIDPIIKGKISPECWEVFIDITKRCLNYDPDERPTMGEVELLLEHALSLQEEADIRKTNDDYTLLSATIVRPEPALCIHVNDIEELICHQFSLADMNRTTFCAPSNMNEPGSFWNVYRGRVRLNGSTDYSIAIMKMDWPSICEKGMQWNFRKEIENTFQLRHPNLVSPLGFCDEHDEKILVYMNFPRGCLHHALRISWSKEFLTWKKRLEICIGAAKGLDYLHTATIFHRNINPNNILLDMTMVPKISGFGIPWTEPIDADYAAPEWLQGQEFTYKCDVYSFGLVLLYVVSGKKSQINKVDIDPILEGKIAPTCWEVFLGITKSCLKIEPTERPKMSEVEAQLKHALALQEEADANTAGDYPPLSKLL